MIEFQKTWTERGFFHKIIKKEYTQKNVLSNTENLISEAREKGVKIIQAPLILNKADKERYRKTPFPARLLKRFIKGTWKAEFTDGIYEKADIIVQGRCGFDACEGSDLEQLLNQNGIKTVFVCGFTTDHCVKETMNSLIDKGFYCILVSDCTATKNNKTQKKIEKEFTIITSNQLIDKINNKL
ncbi:MAG: cysteine hydrolase family protein [Bacteroidales bacterium]|nr:cysteine hydrolase family protein [Bacteroidales bacterium]